MNDKELREIRRRFRPDKNNILSIRGCLVNSEKAIVAQFNQPMAACSIEESEALLAIMKKSLSGGLETNRLDLDLGTRENLESEQYALITALRSSGLKDEAALNQFYEKVIESVRFEGGYAILLAHDTYDVYSYSADGEKQDSSSVFSYIICSICPIKPRSAGLYFRDYDTSFRAVDEQAMLTAPELGFMFPTFDGRATNIYNALYYTKDITDIHPDFIESIFNVEVPMSAARKKDSFDSCLKDSLNDECSFEVVRSVHGQIAEMVQEHKDTKQEEPLKLSKKRLKTVLGYCGVAEDKVDRFGEQFDREFGENAGVAPKSIMDVKKFEMSTPDVSIKINPERTDLVSTQVINGVKYILIRANDGVEVNGVNIDIK